MQVDARALQARRDRELRAELADDFGVKKALEKIRSLQHGRGYGYRRGLLSRALRLSRSMSPEIADLIADCARLIGYPHPIEIYVTPDMGFNASCFRDTHGPTVITLTSRLLECFTPAELRFVVGHELGHAALDHYGLPMPITASLRDMGGTYVSRTTALKLYAWCRAAEISADRIGLVCAADPEAAASGFFKLASGMASDRVKPDLATFARQVESLASAPEARDAPRDDDDTLDCFSTHPYNPVRVRAVWAFSKSAPYLAAIGRPTAGALSLEDVDRLVDRDMALMEPTYLQERTSTNDDLRRLLYTAGVAVAAAHGGVDKVEIDALAMLMGGDHAQMPSDVPAILKDLPGRIAAAKEAPLASRAQLVQHLTIIAAADGEVQDEELVVMEDIASQLGVDARVIHQTIRGAQHPID
ncbi:MAG: M48 family metallopeptidase [Myxococcales bacterium]|nr:M48 family metallopeptidase [Myxococcales bacterium]